MANDIGQWLGNLNLDKYVELFAENDIDLAALPYISDDDLKDLGVTVGARRKILAALRARSDTSHSRPAAEEEDNDPTKSHTSNETAERRQLTVLFCDLVGSTALSGRLDPEDLRDVMRRYQDAVATAVVVHDGFVANYLGDGVVVYFGWPRAHEDQAGQAVRAGLAALEAVAKVAAPDGASLSARVGIATGTVVVGDLAGEASHQADAISGEPPNLAARLQGLAQQDEIVIDEATRQLLGATFEIQDLGNQDLKGVSAPVPAWRVGGEAVIESRFEAAHTDGLTPFVGRAGEVELLLDRWARAEEREGQVILLSGEAGIGKSRIVQTLRERLQDLPHTPLLYQCSPHYTNSALYPVIGQLQRAAGFVREDTNDDKFAKLEAVLKETERPFEQSVALLGDLMSLPVSERYPPLNMTPQRQLEDTFATLVEQASAFAEQAPVLMIFEDLHWADPTSLDLLGSLITMTADHPILMLLTFRPSFVPPWPGDAHVTALTLNRLGRAQGTELVAHLSGGRSLPDVVLRQILEKTEGVPLFVEELTKTVLEYANDRPQPDGQLPNIAIPATLQDSLMARLDRLSPAAKDVAQVGAVLGRSFQLDLLANVIGGTELQLTTATKELVDSGLVYQGGPLGDVRYMFKHALLQESAYQSLLLSRRRTLHRAVATTLEQTYRHIIEREPETAAHHFNESGDAAKALTYWQKAGDNAARRFAVREADQLYDRCLALIPKLENESMKDAVELPLQLAFGNTLIASRGLHVPEVGMAFNRARKLGGKLDRPDLRFEALFGLWVHTVNLPDLKGARRLAASLQGAADETANPEHLMQAHHAAWTNEWLAGNFRLAVDHTTEGCTHYDVNAHQHHKFRYGGHDPAICGLQMQGLSLCFLGYPDQAIAYFASGKALARKVDHPFSTVLLLFFHTITRYLRGETDDVLKIAMEANDIAQSNGVSLWSIVAGSYGWAEFQKGDCDGGLARIHEGLDASKSIGTELFRPYSLGLYSSCLIELQRFDEARAAIEEGLAVVARIGGEHWYRADLVRLRAELLSAQGAPDNEIEASLNDALAAARQADARFSEIKVATLMASLWHRQGRLDAARSLLAPLYAWFTEGFDTSDLKEAKALLDDLS